MLEIIQLNVGGLCLYPEGVRASVKSRVRAMGNVRISGDNVLWVLNDRKEIKSFLILIAPYPFLTTRKKLQLDFMLDCLEHNDVFKYMCLRDFRYLTQDALIKHMSLRDLTLLPYFNPWLSGFMEAESCFTIRANKVYSFSIGQNNDKYLLESIKTYFQASNMVREPKLNFYLLEVYKKETLRRVYAHCENYPLLGQKHIDLITQQQESSKV
jgi:hypothetical protein